MSAKIHTDVLTRRLYAADASIYEEVPAGVAFPRSAAELAAILAEARADGRAVTLRAGGTSLAGQATGGGVVVDVSRHLDRILGVDPAARTARVEPGVIRDSLNRAALPHGLHFAPDTSTTNRCTVGGMIGNNSCGSFSLVHGTTRDHVVEIEALLADGTAARFGPLAPGELEARGREEGTVGRIHREMAALVREHRDGILAHAPHPDLLRRNTGYALDRLAASAPFTPDGPPFSLAEFLCGSEGTLAVTTAATVRLTPLPRAKLLLVAQFETLREALEATVEAVRWGPAAVELVDDPILQATKGNLEQRRNRFFLEGDPAAILIIQFDGEPGEALRERAEGLRASLVRSGQGYAHPIIEGAGPMARVWELRKAGLGLLGGLGSDSRTPSFMEDTAVRVEDLPAFVEEVQRLLERYGTRCVFYGHASVGELHLRPMIDLTRPEGLRVLDGMSREIAGIVRRFRGSLSGEHGDGRVRAPYLEEAVGPEMVALFRRVKEIWDPANLLNPGKIVNPLPVDRDLRFHPEYRRTILPTVFHWRDAGGFGAALEACNGAGVCRKLAASGGTMCPSYHATREERDSTRGRANLFRQLFEGAGPEAFESEELAEALSLCLSCKACKSECPANVDMARMKAEFTHGRHGRRGIPLADRVFGDPGPGYALARIAPGIANAFLRSGAGRRVMERAVGVDPRRSLPAFAPRTFRAELRRSRRRKGHRPALPGAPKVVLLVDLFTDHHEPEIAFAALELLEGWGYEVLLPDLLSLGRTHLSRGLLDRAATLATRNVALLAPWAEAEVPIVGLEPSEILTLRDEYLDLVAEEDLAAARQVAERSFLFEEFALRHLESEEAVEGIPHGGGRPVAIHGHCHTKALVGNEPLTALLERCGFLPTALATGCCGMAGSFGYAAANREISLRIGEETLFPQARALPDGTLLCAPGFSCRHQVADGTGIRALHPAELLRDALHPARPPLLRGRPDASPGLPNPRQTLP